MRLTRSSRASTAAKCSVSIVCSASAQKTKETHPSTSKPLVALPASAIPSTQEKQRESVVAMASISAGVAKPRVALLGVGLMGNKMAQRLRTQGFTVTVWNRTAEKCTPLESAGCSLAKSAEDAIKSADVVLLMLADAAAIEATILQNAAAKSALKGKTVVQMGTIGPNQAKEIAAHVEAVGASFLEAPVLGSQPEAVAGTLLVMVGCKGDMKASPAFPVLQAFGTKISQMGEVGTAAASKLALNQLISSLTIGFSTSLAMVQKNEVDLDTWMGILRESALYAPTYDKKLSKYVSRDYGTANFPTKHLLKDVRLFAEEADKTGQETGFLHAMENICAEAVARGFENADYSAVYEAVLEPVRPGDSVTPEA